MANSSLSSHPVVRFLRHEWRWIGVVSMAVSLMTMLSLYAADPRFHEVWQYTPAAIPTLAFVESVIQGTPVLVPSNYATWFGVWVLTSVLSNPKWIVIIMYVGATVSTAVSAYVVFRVRNIAPALAMLGALAFALGPARFVQPVLALHWWAVMPVVLWWGLTWWDGVRPQRDVVWAGMTVALLALSGDTIWWWASVVVLTCAVIATLMHRTWRPISTATIMVVSSLVLMRGCAIIWPMPTIAGDAGIRLSALWIPTATHRIDLFGQLGRDFVALDVVHTDITYVGVFALIGLVIAVAQALMRSVAGGAVTHVHRLLLVAGVLVIIANQRGLAFVAQFGGVPALSSASVDVWLALIGVTVLITMMQKQTATWWLVAIIGIGVLFDQLPRTNIMDQMMQRPIHVTTRSWRDGVWFGQDMQAQDVVAMSGVGVVEPGFGRWSDAALADHVAIELAEPIAQPVTLEIRARGVGVNIGAPVIVQIGDEQQSIVLTESVASYQLSFERPQGNVIAIYPQPVTEPPPGDSRRIGVFLQSIRVITP